LEKSSKLVVILSEPISTWIEKGEIVDRYFNPGNVFTNILIILTNNDQPDPNEVKRLVGNAEFQVFNLKAGLRVFLFSLGWLPNLLHFWLMPAIDLIEKFKPNVIRCYSAHLNVEIARQAKRILKIPFIVSLHINPNFDLNSQGTIKQKIGRKFIKRIEKRGLLEADLVLPVYSTIIPFLNELGVVRYVVAYNMSNSRSLRVKENYSYTNDFKLISIGRLIPEKSPTNIILAMKYLKLTNLKLIGDGPMYSHVQNLIEINNLSKRIELIKSLPNDKLCEQLYDADAFIVESKFHELSKVVIEACLSGLPIILNKELQERVSELRDLEAFFCDSNPSAFAQAVEVLKESEELRRKLGVSALKFGQSLFASEKTENRFSKVYENYLY